MADSVKNKTIIAQVFAHCWSDHVYKSNFLLNPKPVLLEAGFDFENIEKVKIYENSENISYLILPEIFTAESAQKLADDFDLKKSNFTVEKEIRIVKNSSKVLNLVLPQKPDSSGKEINEYDLQKAAGGTDVIAQINSYVTVNFEIVSTLNSTENNTIEIVVL